METLSAGEILNRAADRAGIERGQVDTDLFRKLRASLSRRLRLGWRYRPWPELVRIEKRYFRKLWTSAEAAQVGGIAAGEERYYNTDGNHYRALVTNGVDPLDDDDNLRAAQWALLETSYDADDWDEATAYDIGDQVYDPETDLFYQCRVTTTAGIEPTDEDYWAALVPFDRYVAYEQEGETALGDVLKVTELNPKIYRSPKPVTFSLSENGVQVLEELGWVWIEFRLRVPVLTGDVYDSDAAYAADDQVYYEGDFYNCIEAATAGENPADVPEKWEKVELPLFLESYLVQAVFADYLEMEGQKEKAQAELGLAELALADEALLLFGQNPERSELMG